MKEDAKYGQGQDSLPTFIEDVVLQESHCTFDAGDQEKTAEIIMNVHLVFLVLPHQTDPNQRAYHVNEKHDEEKLHQRVLVCIEVPIAIHKFDLAFDQQVRLLCIESLLGLKSPALLVICILLLIFVFLII